MEIKRLENLDEVKTTSREQSVTRRIVELLSTKSVVRHRRKVPVFYQFTSFKLHNCDLGCLFA